MVPSKMLPAATKRQYRVQFSASFITSLSVFDEICGTAMDFVFFLLE